MSRSEVIRFCNLLGADRKIVQAAGGNVSWKDGDVLWVKASGMWLADAGLRDIFVDVDLAALSATLACGNFDVQVLPRNSSCGLRPSIETALHALMPQRIVAHLHHVDALAHLVRAECSDALARVRAAGLSVVEIPYRKPGGELAQAVSQALQAQSRTTVVLMRNHGIVIGGEDVAEVEVVLKILNDALFSPVMFAGHDLSLLPAAPLGWQPISDGKLHALATDMGLFKRVVEAWSLYPDHVVFLGPFAQTMNSVSELESLPQVTDVGFVRGSGVYVRPTFSAAKLAQLRCYFDVLVRQAPSSDLVCLTPTDVAALLDWDAERYRQCLSRPA